ncbi:hypothetical protein ACOME3_007278 [Neoechinorhynchus agilis]
MSTTTPNIPYETPMESIRSLFAKVIHESYGLDGTGIKLLAGRANGFRCACAFDLAKQLMLYPSTVADTIAINLKTVAHGTFVDGGSILVTGKGDIFFDLCKVKLPQLLSSL